jgi:hypothetical protein
MKVMITEPPSFHFHLLNDDNGEQQFFSARAAQLNT